MPKARLKRPIVRFYSENMKGIAMKVLFYRYNSICEPDIADAFRELGHDVFEITAETQRKDVTPSECVKIVSEALETRPCDFVFTVDFFPVISEVCRAYHIHYLSWIVDSPVLELYSKSIKNNFNRIFVFDRTLCDEIKQYNPTRIFHLPLAAGIAGKSRTIGAATAADITRFSSDVSFVGSLYTEKSVLDKLQNPPDYLRGFIDALMELQTEIYGDYFITNALSDEIVADFKAHFPDFYMIPEEALCSDRLILGLFYLGYGVTAKERTRLLCMLSEKYGLNVFTASDTSKYPLINNKGAVKSLTEMPLVFANSKINLNITARSIRMGIPQRIWDVFASQGFLISNFQEEIYDYFVPGEDLIIFESAKDLDDKIAYYLEKPVLRREIAASAYEKVLKYHTFTIRVQEMLDLAFGKKAFQ